MIKLKNLLEELDYGDVITLDIEQVRCDKDSMFDTLQDMLQGRFSHTAGPIDVWKQEDKYYLTDGYHRFCEHLLLDKGDTIRCELVGFGYSKHWKLPTDPNEQLKVDSRKEYNGLEDIAGKVVLEKARKNASLS